MEWLFLLIGLLIGAILGVLVHRRMFQGNGSEALQLLQAERENERREHERRAGEKEMDLRDRQDRLIALSGDLASEKQRNEGLLEKLATQEAQLQESQKHMTDQFTLIADKLLGEKSKELSAQQHEKLGTLLKPLQDRIREFEEQVRKTYQEEERERFALKKEIVALVQNNQKLSQDADNLTKALKGDNKTQGDWGEMILERLLENSGLVQDEEYTLQTSNTLEDGSRLRPDAVVNLPGGKHIVIDAKVSLTHYERFVASADDGERERRAKAHTDSVRAHMKGLSQKDYPKLYGIASPEFVFMFVPIEAAFNLAQSTRREIVQEAIEQRIYIVTHSTLLASLKLFHSIWKNERIARNHLEIAERAGALYEKFVGFTEDLGRIGKQIKGAQESYDDALKKLSDGPGNLVRQVEMMKALGAKTAKAIHPKLLERSLEEENTPGA